MKNRKVYKNIWEISIKVMTWLNILNHITLIAWNKIKDD